MAKHMVGLLRLSSDYTVCKNILCELVYIRPDSKGLASDYTMGKHTINNITWMCNYIYECVDIYYIYKSYIHESIGISYIVYRHT